jgi:hypothetical protein
LNGADSDRPLATDVRARKQDATGGLEGVVLEPIAKGMDTLGVVDRVSEGEEVVLTQSAQ